VTLKKLKFMTISVYGHDCDSFVRIAKSTEKVYARLLANLETLLGIIDKFPGVLHIAIRSTLDMPRKPTTDLLRMIDRFRQAGIKIKHSALYHDWGGYITAADTEGLNLAVMDSSKIYKSGACSLLFTGVQIMATGIVHACACVDVDGTLKIGDLSEKPLRDIVSSKNPLYMDFIEEQQRGIFKPVCQSCGFYKSIYHSRKMHKQDGTEIASIDEFKTKLDDRVAAAKAAAG
jgi:hypothetical protein